MRGAWWKILAILFVLGTFVTGNLIPLRSGIVSNKTDLLVYEDSTFVMNVLTYNTEYITEGSEAIQARIRLNEERAACAHKIEVRNNRHLVLHFTVPNLAAYIKTEEERSIYPKLEIGSVGSGYLFASSLPVKKQDSSRVTFIAPCDIQPYPEIDEARYPFLNILEETIRNLFFHVPMWFGMMLLMLISVVYSIKTLRRPDISDNDHAAVSFAGIGLLYGFLGITTGAMWAAYTWGTPWSWDVKQNTSAVVLLIYLAYFVLRSSIEDNDKKARIGAIYNIFAFATLIPLLYIIPRMVDSMHPGMKGNPAFSSYDLDSTMRLIFYPAVIGWILLGVWISTLVWRIRRLEDKAAEQG